MAFSGNPNSHQQQSSMYQQQASSHHHMRAPPAMSFETNANSNMMYDYHATNNNNKMHRGSMNGLRQKLREAAGFPLREQHSHHTGNNSNGMHSTSGTAHYGNANIGRGASGNGKDYRNNNMNDPGFRGSHQRSSSYYNQDNTNSSYGLHQPPPRFSHQNFPQSSMMTQYPQPASIMPRGNFYEPSIGPMMGGPYQQPLMYHPQQYHNNLADPMMGMGMGMGMMGTMPMPEPYLNPYQTMHTSMYNQHPMMMPYNNNPMVSPLIQDQGMFPGTMPYGSYPTSYNSMPYNNRFSSGFW